MKLIKRYVEDLQEEVVVINYSKWTKELDWIENYVLSSGKHITGYGKNKEMKEIWIDEILYFEAVGELVFAYTKDEVYEIKQRLYQIENTFSCDKIKRVSKSVLINLFKMESIRPAMNGRLYAKMENGEDILVSRHYAKELTAELTA